ncbi:hypothetical protein PVAND_000111 [Polypedilum vanderplanki]|uniref:Uncharacterized protein n=1 Tax=Polypedilum vanderplanki TaxID=319348 RepID=A0A9J6BJB9_POLVA|nr:hypothetical protein PVAND_000111 [Polypedilum vanderplanki]
MKFLFLLISLRFTSINSNSFYIIHSAENDKNEQDENIQLDIKSNAEIKVDEISNTIDNFESKWEKYAKNVKNLHSLYASKIRDIGRIISIDDEEITTIETSDDDYTEAPDVVSSYFNISVENYKISSVRDCGFYVKDDGWKFMTFGCGEKWNLVTIIDEYKFKCLEVIINNDSHEFLKCRKIDNKKYSPITADDIQMENYEVDDLLTNFYIPKSKNDEEILCESFDFRIRNDVYALKCQEKNLNLPKIIKFHKKFYKCEDGSDLDEDYFIYGLCEIVSDENVPHFDYQINQKTLEDIDDQESITTTTEILPNMKKWVKMCQKSTKVPENSVIAGKNHDGLPFYVIRKKIDDEYFFGRFVEGDSIVGFVTNEEEEIELSDFEILTATNYKWCKYDSDHSYSSCLPICRACVNRTKIPGTLLDDGVCRIGYDSKIYEKSSRVQVLILGVTSCE